MWSYVEVNCWISGDIRVFIDEARGIVDFVGDYNVQILLRAVTGDFLVGVLLRHDGDKAKRGTVGFRWVVKQLKLLLVSVCLRLSANCQE